MGCIGSKANGAPGTGEPLGAANPEAADIQAKVQTAAAAGASSLACGNTTSKHTNGLPCPDNDRDAPLDPADIQAVDIEIQEAVDAVGSLPGKAVTEGQPVQPSDGKPASDEGVEHSHVLLQKSLPQIPASNVDLGIRAAGLKHIGFGPLKKENQDEYFVQVGGFGGSPSGSCYCIFDGHGSYGRDAAAFCCRELPVLFDQELRRHYQQASELGIANPNGKEQIESILSDAFVETERRLRQAGINVSSSGTTASVVYQNNGSVWVGAVGDSRVVVLHSNDGAWGVQPLTLDHRPSRKTEKTRVEAAGGRVEPKRLASGKTVGEPRLWLAHLPSPGLLLSRSLGDEVASSVGCTSRPEVTFMALRPYQDQYIVIGSDGVWDVLENMRVAQAVAGAADPEQACQRVLEEALLEWEERLAADNVSVIVVQLQWGEVHLPANGAGGSAGGAPAADGAQLVARTCALGGRSQSSLDALASAAGAAVASEG